MTTNSKSNPKEKTRFNYSSPSWRNTTSNLKSNERFFSVDPAEKTFFTRQNNDAIFATISQSWLEEPSLNVRNKTNSVLACLLKNLRHLWPPNKGIERLPSFKLPFFRANYIAWFRKTITGSNYDPNVHNHVDFLSVLNRAFNENASLTRKTLSSLQKATGLSKMAICSWFRWKRESVERPKLLLRSLFTRNQYPNYAEKHKIERHSNWEMPLIDVWFRVARAMCNVFEIAKADKEELILWRMFMKCHEGNGVTDADMELMSYLLDMSRLAVYKIFLSWCSNHGVENSMSIPTSSCVARNRADRSTDFLGHQDDVVIVDEYSVPFMTCTSTLPNEHISSPCVDTFIPHNVAGAVETHEQLHVNPAAYKSGKSMPTLCQKQASRQEKRQAFSQQARLFENHKSPTSNVDQHHDHDNTPSAANSRIPGCHKSDEREVSFLDNLPDWWVPNDDPVKPTNIKQSHHRLVLKSLKRKNWKHRKEGIKKRLYELDKEKLIMCPTVKEEIPERIAVSKEPSEAIHMSTDHHPVSVKLHSLQPTDYDTEVEPLIKELQRTSEKNNFQIVKNTCDVEKSVEISTEDLAAEEELFLLLGSSAQDDSPLQY